MTEKEKYQEEFVVLQNDLRAFIYRIVNHRQETLDLVQDTYERVIKNLDSFKGKSSFKTWVFAIAINLARNSLRAKRRWGEDWQDIGKDFNQSNPAVLEEKAAISQTSEQGKFFIREHINFCFTCINKTLLLRNQICLLLKDIFDFKVKEIEMITGLTEGQVKHAVAHARRALTHIFEKRCALINKKGICHQCTELNNIFNPKQEAHIEANKVKMVKEAKHSSYSELLRLRLQLVKSIDPLHAEGSHLHNYILENCPDWVTYQKKAR